nr:MAG TPA: hypothetical protein [Caudoviricetes sp.]
MYAQTSFNFSDIVSSSLKFGIKNKPIQKKRLMLK